MGNFRDKLNQRATATGGSSSKIKVINMQSKSNQGSLFFIPFTGSDGSDAIQTLNSVLEVKERYEYKDKDEKVQKGERWIKLLHRSDYNNGEGLRGADLETYQTLRSLSKHIMDHKFSRNAKKNDTIKRGIIRVKNYTLLMGIIVELTNSEGKVIYKKQPAVLVFSSAKFDKALNSALEGKDKSTGGSEWQMKLFNRDQFRKQFLSIEYKISENPKEIGYKASISIEKFDDETKRLSDGREDGYQITDEDYKTYIEGFTNPTNIFLKIKLGDDLFKDEYITNLTERINQLCEEYLEGYGGNSISKAPEDDDEPDSTDERMEMEGGSITPEDDLPF